jgi:cation transport ATPase
MGTSTFFINKIDGEKDIQSLEQYLSAIPGIERVLMDTADNELKIEFNEQEIEQKYIVEKIEGQGFKIQ